MRILHNIVILYLDLHIHMLLTSSYNIIKKNRMNFPFCSNFGFKIKTIHNEPVFLVLRVWLLLVWELQVTK